MSDGRSDRVEEEILARLLDDLGRGRVLEADEADPADARVRRELLETLGLLALSLPPEQPSAACRRRLLAAVGSSAVEGAVQPVAPLATPAKTAPSGRWALPLAASLAFLLAGFSGWQYVRLQEQSSTIGRLSERLAEVEARALQMQEIRGQVGALRSRLALVTGRGVEVCTLRPPGGGPLTTGARGVLFASADHRSWYLSIAGLEPCSRGREYQLWFVPVDGDPISAGTFDVASGIRVELSSDRMPANTRAVSVTLEPAGGSDAPTGPAVLYGDEVMRLL